MCLLIPGGIVLLSLSAALAQTQPSPLTITPVPAQRTVAGTPFQLQLSAHGGTPTYTWRLLQTPLPAGLTLDPKTGLISGTPTVSGEFRIAVAVTDLSAPPQEARTEIVLTIIAGLEIKWKQPPQVRDGGIFGSVIVTNNTGRTLQLTVIVLAVNETNKAFALGYQHFDFNPQSESPVIPLGTTLPFGSYVVHADAIAEDPPRNMIFRARMQTSQRFIIQQQ